jgi:hypothetical protein
MQHSSGKDYVLAVLLNEVHLREKTPESIFPLTKHFFHKKSGRTMNKIETLPVCSETIACCKGSHDYF